MLRERVRTFLATKLTGARDLEIERFDRISGGFSWEVFRVDASWRADTASHRAAYIFRMAPEGGVLEPYDAEREFRILKALGATAVPVPRVMWLEKDPALLGKEFYVMEFVAGEIPVPWDDALAGDPVRAVPMHRQFVEVVAAIHRLDWRKAGLDFLGVPPPGAGSARREIERCQATYERDRGDTYPVVEEALRWLRAHAPATDRLTLVHGDCRMGNFIWRDGRIVAFLDWERALIGDPMADIAWSCTAGASGWCSIDGEMGDYYEQLSGVPIDSARVHFWTVLEGVKAFTIGLTAFKAFTEGRGRDLRLVTIGRMAHLGLPAVLQAISG